MPSVISVVFCLKPRAYGQSALYDSFSHLSSDKSPCNHVLFGWTGEIPGDPTLHDQDHREIETSLRKAQCGVVEPIWLCDKVLEGPKLSRLADQGRWRRFGERRLFPLFHYKLPQPTDGRCERAWWADYSRLNNIFADRIVNAYRSGDSIWIHDYQLCLLPAILRQRLPQAKIGFFLHIPFPSCEYIRCLPQRKQILEGILGANLVGFQSPEYARHFVSSCRRILGYGCSSSGIDAFGSHVTVDAFPIGIAASATEKFAFDNTQVEDKLRSIRELYAGKKLIVGRDRLDSVRGLTHKLQAFEKFLDDYPEWLDKVVLIQVTNPTGTTEEQDSETRKTSSEVSELVSRINGLHGSISFSPVRHYPQYISKEEYFALLRAADLGLITSVRDGMSTASLEYIVCQKGRYGPMILSEFSGTADNLTSATTINPWDLADVARSIERALTMPEPDRKAQFEKLYMHVATNTVASWTDNFLNRLDIVTAMYGRQSDTPVLDATALLNSYQASEKRLFLFDYDGTLTPIVKDPRSAIPSDKILHTLRSLASDNKNAVWVISGRDQQFLDQWIGQILGIGLSAEHGSFIRHPMERSWENVTEKTDMSWQKDVLSIFEDFTEATEGSRIEQKKVALTWHYRGANPEWANHQARECRRVLEDTVGKAFEIEVMEGKANLEVRPRFVNKGVIASRLVSEFEKSNGTEGASGSAKPDFVLCLGDDFTDEDMFRALKTSSLRKGAVFSCTVGASSRQTEADWHLLEPSDVLSTISILSETAKGTTTATVRTS